MPDEHTERMVQFHVHAANTQLRQVYFGFIAALGLGRVLIMPKVSTGAKYASLTMAFEVIKPPSSLAVSMFLRQELEGNHRLQSLRGAPLVLPL